MSPIVSDSGSSHLVAEVEAVVVVKALEFSLEIGTIEKLKANNERISIVTSYIT